MPSIQDRFSASYAANSTTGCWEWTKTVLRNGYGQIYANGKKSYAHRLSYELSVGLIPEGLQIDHLCRNRRCVNPEHLEAVTQQVNISRGISGNRKFSKVTCKYGHPYSGSNIGLTKKQYHYCKRCAADYQAALRRKRRV